MRYTRDGGTEAAEDGPEYFVQSSDSRRDLNVLGQKHSSNGREIVGRSEIERRWHTLQICRFEQNAPALVSCHLHILNVLGNSPAGQMV